MIRITKEFKFEMAHALYGYDGLCKNIHGHSYRMWVTVKGNVLQKNKHVKNGMVIDFGELKKIIKDCVVDKYDHSFVLNKNTPHFNIDFSAFEKVYFLPYQPTSENLVADFAKVIMKKIPENITLHKVVLSETATSFAEWHSDDYK
tara:strand:- start:292 stop:729 length:438 start_codon:yes stop_codon:yes gene_type:complete